MDNRKKNFVYMTEFFFFFIWKMLYCGEMTGGKSMNKKGCNLKKILIGVSVVVMILAMFIYDGYHSFQGTNRESKAHKIVEKQIEQSEDTLSRTDRIIRLFTFRDKVQIALNQRVSKEHWVKGDVIPEYTKNALIAIEDKRYYKHGAKIGRAHV